MRIRKETIMKTEKAGRRDETGRVNGIILFMGSSVIDGNRI
jgi:hypothetical protein